MQNTQKLAISLVGGALIGAYALLMPMRALAQSSDPLPGAALRAAIEAHLESEGFGHAGLCREIEQQDHFGEACAFVFHLDGNEAVVSYGPVASDEIREATFVLRDGEWIPDSEAAPSPELPQAVPGGLAGVIREFLEQRGLSYAGLCTEITPWEHYGEYCAMVTTVDRGKATVSYGLVASDDIQQETFFLDELGWHATSSGPIVPPDYGTPSPVPPTTTPEAGEPGDDANNDSAGTNDHAAFILALVAGTVLVGGAGTYGISRRRS